MLKVAPSLMVKVPTLTPAALLMRTPTELVKVPMVGLWARVPLKEILLVVPEPVSVKVPAVLVKVPVAFIVPLPAPLERSRVPAMSCTKFAQLRMPPELAPNLKLPVLVRRIVKVPFTLIVLPPSEIFAVWLEQSQIKFAKVLLELVMPLVIDEFDV